MLRAVSIDGFGWFTEADYRRTWLFFDEVDYLLLKDPIPPFGYAPEVWLSKKYRIVHSGFDELQIQQLIASAIGDMERLAFRRLVESLVPASDLAYAALVVRSDRSVLRQLSSKLIGNGLFAIALLLNELVLHAALTGAVPVLGRRYATELLIQKLEGWREAQLSTPVSAPATPRQSVSFSAFAAGLSLGFIPDEGLAALDFELLFEFKRKHGELLHRHQAQLLDVAARFQGLPGEGPEFDERLATLRAEAALERHQLEGQARAAWGALGVEATKNAVVAGSTALVTGLAVVRGYTLADLISVGIPAAVAGAGAATATALDAIAKQRKSGPATMAYLLETKKLLDP